MSQAHALANLFLLLALPIAGLALALVVGTAIVNPTGSAKLALGFYVIGLVLSHHEAFSSSIGPPHDVRQSIDAPGPQDPVSRRVHPYGDRRPVCHRSSRERNIGVASEPRRSPRGGRATCSGMTLTMRGRLTSGSSGRRPTRYRDIEALPAAAQPDRYPDMRSTERTPIIFLLGPSGSGKTNLGSWLGRCPGRC